MSKPFSQACENNKQAILDCIGQYFKPGQRILEIGSGTAQHAVFFVNKLKDIVWQPSEMSENMQVLLSGLGDEILTGLLPPVELDVRKNEWQVPQLDGVFTANTLHIMAKDSVKDFFRGAAQHTGVGGHVCVYGPFKYGGEFTTQSNEKFDHWLKERNPESGIRDFEYVCELAEQEGLKFIEDQQMPANNQLLVWQKKAT